MEEKISGIYRITNTVTNDCYIGSSKDVKRRWKEHKCKSTWKRFPNNQLYQDMQKFGVNGFAFEILAEVEESFLKEKEQYFIETLKPTYNNRNANGFDFERRKEYQKEYNKEYCKEYYSQLCFYNGETLTLHALQTRFWRRSIPHPTQEAKKYLIKDYSISPSSQK